MIDLYTAAPERLESVGSGKEMGLEYTAHAVNLMKETENS